MPQNNFLCSKKNLVTDVRKHLSQGLECKLKLAKKGVRLVRAT